MRSRLLASSLFTAITLLAACGDDPATPPTPGKASLRVVHASPDAPAVDIYAVGVATPLISNLAYGQASAYIEVDEGTYDLQVKPAGQPTAAAVYDTGNLTLAADDKITAIAAGFLTSTADADKFRVLPLAEGFTAPGTGNAAVRIVHASADAPTVGVDVGDDNPAAPEVAALARFADTGAAGIALPAGQALQVGIDAGGARVTAFTTPELPAGADLFVIATGRLGDLPREATGFGLLAVGPSGVVGLIKQNPVVYALHASPDAPAVDIRAGATGPVLLGDVAFGDLGAVQVPPGDYELAFYGAGGAPGTPAATAPVDGLAAGERYLAIATGFLSPASGEAPFQLLAFQDGFTQDTSPRVRAIHASPDAPAVDIGVASGNTLAQALITNIAFKSGTPGEGLVVPAAASIRIGVAATGTTATAATFNISTASNPRAFVVAAGALSPVAGEEGFRLLQIDTSASPWALTELMPNAN